MSKALEASDGRISSAAVLPLPGSTLKEEMKAHLIRLGRRSWWDLRCDVAVLAEAACGRDNRATLKLVNISTPRVPESCP